MPLTPPRAESFTDELIVDPVADCDVDTEDEPPFNGADDSDSDSFAREPAESDGVFTTVGAPEVPELVTKPELPEVVALTSQLYWSPATLVVML